MPTVRTCSGSSLYDEAEESSLYDEVEDFNIYDEVEDFNMYDEVEESSSLVSLLSAVSDGSFGIAKNSDSFLCFFSGGGLSSSISTVFHKTNAAQPLFRERKVQNEKLHEKKRTNEKCKTKIA